MITKNLGLTVDLPQSTTDIPTQVTTYDENLKIIDEAFGKISNIIDSLNGEVV